MEVELTKGQCESLVDFIECNLISSIRADEYLDNLQYVINICDAYKTFKYVCDFKGVEIDQFKKEE